jgi:hypothetical protein
MKTDTTNSGPAESKKHVFVLKTNVFHSGIGGLRMRTSLAYRAAIVTGIYLNLADSRWVSFLDSHFIFPSSIQYERHWKYLEIPAKKLKNPDDFLTLCDQHYRSIWTAFLFSNKALMFVTLLA